MLTCSARKFKLPLCNSTTLFLHLTNNYDSEEVVVVVGFFFWGGGNMLAFVMTAFVSEYILYDYLK